MDTRDAVATALAVAAILLVSIGVGWWVHTAAGLVAAGGMIAAAALLLAFAPDEGEYE